MRKEIVLPVVAAAMGAAGFALRKWELASAFEADTGLPISGAPATGALIVLSIAAAVILFFLCRAGYRPFTGGYDAAEVTAALTLTVDRGEFTPGEMLDIMRALNTRFETKEEET